MEDKPKETEENPNNPLGYSETQLNRTKPKKADALLKQLKEK